MATTVETEPASAACEDLAAARMSTADQRVDQVLRYAVPVATGLVAVGVVLRFVARSQLWLDEALSVNIARLPARPDPRRPAPRRRPAPVLRPAPLLDAGLRRRQLRRTGPVRAWRRWPASPWPGSRASASVAGAWPGRRSLLMASSPFAISYATSARMYSFMILWALLGFLALARALEDAGHEPPGLRRRRNRRWSSTPTTGASTWSR